MSIRGVHTWNGTCTVRWPWVMAGIIAVAGVVFGLTLSAWWLILVFFVTAVPALFFTRLDVTVDMDGLAVSFGSFKWPTKRISLDQIASAESVDLNPWAWGGWGYRWAPGKKSAAVLRKGPAIMVTKHDGRRFAVTVDDAPLGAATLQSHIDALPPR